MEPTLLFQELRGSSDICTAIRTILFIGRRARCGGAGGPPECHTVAAAGGPAPRGAAAIAAAAPVAPPCCGLQPRPHHSDADCRPARNAFCMRRLVHRQHHAHKQICCHLAAPEGSPALQVCCRSSSLRSRSASRAAMPPTAPASCAGPCPQMPSLRSDSAQVPGLAAGSSSSGRRCRCAMRALCTCRCASSNAKRLCIACSSTVAAASQPLSADDFMAACAPHIPRQLHCRHS